MFFTEKILEKLLMHTNRKLYKNNNIIHTNATFKQLNIMKLRTFIAFLYLMIIIYLSKIIVNRIWISYIGYSKNEKTLIGNKS